MTRIDRSNIWLRLLGTLRDTDEVSQIPVGLLNTGAQVFVSSLGQFYLYIAESTDAPNGTTVLAPAHGTGRWFLAPMLLANTSLVPGATIADALNTLFGQGGSNVQAEWYVDPINGDDNAAGSSPATALKTMNQLSDRIRNAYIRQTTTIHLLGDIPADDPFIFSGIIGGLTTQLIIQGEAPTVLASGALTFVQNVVLGTTRPSIRVAGIADWATAGPGGTSLVGKRVRVTAGPVDTLFWIMLRDSGDPSLAYISTPLNVGTVQSLSVGNEIVVEELTRVGPLSIPWVIDGIERTSTVVCTVQHVRTPFGIGRFGSGQGALVSGAQAQVQAYTLLYGCELRFDNLQLDAGTIRACCIQGRQIHILQLGSGVSAQAAAFRASVRTQISTGALALQSQSMFQNGALVLGTSRNEVAYLEVENGCSFWGWPQNLGAVSLAAGAAMRLSSLVWGLSTNAGTFGFSVSSGAVVTYTVKPTIVGAATPKDVSLGGVDTDWATVPTINPANNAAFVVLA